MTLSEDLQYWLVIFQVNFNLPCLSYRALNVDIHSEQNLQHCEVEVAEKLQHEDWDHYL